MFGFKNPFRPFLDIPAKLSAIAAALNAQGVQLAAIDTRTIKMDHTLDDTLAAVTAESTQIDGLTTLFNGVEKQLADALAGTAISPAVQAKIDAVFDGVTNNAAKVQAAITAGTPAAPAPAAP